MLVLTRRIGEEIRIGDNVRLVLVATDRRAAKLGITAPPSVAVDREEVARGRKKSRGGTGGAPSPKG